MDKNVLLELKIDKSLRRRYFRMARYPFNLAYYILLITVVLAICYASYSYLNSNGSILAAAMFVSLGLGVWCGVWYYARHYHCDRRMMYKRFEHTTLKKGRVITHYTDIISKLGKKQEIRCSDIFGLTLLSDERTGLEVLRIEAKKSILMAYDGRTGNTPDDDLSAIPINYVFIQPDSNRLYPLYYQNNQVLIDFLIEKTGLELVHETIDLRTLKEKLKL